MYYIGSADFVFPFKQTKILTYSESERENRDNPFGGVVADGTKGSGTVLDSDDMGEE